MPAPPLLYGCRDSPEMQSMSYRSNVQSTLTVAVGLSYSGMTLTIGAGGSETWWTPAANYYALLSGGGRSVFGRIVELNTTAHTIFFLPINDFDTYDQTAFTFPIGSTLTGIGFVPMELPIDLSEAEPGPLTGPSGLPGYYKYLILVGANVVSLGGQAPVDMWSFLNARPGSPFYVESTWHTQAHQSLFNTRTMNYFSARTTLVRGGDTRVVTLRMGFPAGAPLNYNAEFSSNSRIAAIRVDTCPVFLEASGTGATTTSNTQSTIPGADLTLPEAGDYMVVASATEGSDNLGAATELRCDISNAAGTPIITLALQYDTSQVVGDRRSFGCARFVAGCAAGQHARLRFNTGFPGNIVRVDDWYICAFKLPPGVLGSYTALGSTGTSVSSSTVEVANGTMTLPAAGRYLEFVHARVANVTGGTDRRVFVRPRFPPDQSWYYGGTGYPRGRVYKHPQTGTNVQGTFFHRTKRASGSNKVYADAWDESGETGAIVTVGDWSALYFPDMAKVDQDQVVTAKVETAYWWRRWNAYVDPDSFQHSLPIGARVSRVIRGGVDMIRVPATLAAADQYNHDESLGQVRIRMPAGKAPSDPDQVVLVCVWIFAATDAISLIESPSPFGPAQPQPYRARLISEPDYAQEIRADGTGVTSSSTIGQIDLAAADGVFDRDVRRRRIDGLRTIIRRGPRSDLRESSHAIQLLATNGGHVLDTKLSVKLYSSLIELTRPLSEATMQVFQGGILQDAVPVPVCFGVIMRVPAYAVGTAGVWTPGAGNSTTYRITSAALGLESIQGALFLDPAKSTQVPTIAYTLTGGNSNDGSLIVANSAFSDPNTPPDVVYVRVNGTRSIPGSPYTSRVLRNPGEIARTLLTAAVLGKISLDRIDEQSFIDFDRLWRKRIVSGAPQQIPPVIGAYFAETISIGDAVSQVLGMCFGLRSELPAGRINAGVVDFGAQQLATNPGFESSSTNVWPWFLQGNGTAVVTTNPTYEGSRAVEVGSGTNPGSSMYQPITIRKPGFAVATTPLIALKSGLDKYVRLGIQRPSDGYTQFLSEPFLISSGAWARCVFWLQLDEDEVGPVLAYVFPAWNITGANTSILVDNFEAWPVAVVSRNRRTATLSEEDEESYYQARVEVSLNPLADLNPAVLLTDGDLLGLSTGVSLAKFAAPGSGRADFGSDTRILTADSAAGIAAAVLRYFATPRHMLKTTEIVGWRRPAVNDILLDDSQFRKVSAADENPIYSIRRVAGGKSARTVDLVAETRSSLVSDTLDISPQTVPLGLILPLTSGSTCPTDWSTYTAPADYYLTGAIAGDLAPGTPLGQWRHQHALNHQHTIQAHVHAVTGATIGNIYPAFGAPPITVALPRAPAARTDHSHGTVGGGPWNTGAIKILPGTGGSSNISTNPNASLLTHFSGNVIPCTRFMLCKRTANTVGPIPTNLGFFSQSATAPGGFMRATEFDGKVLRVCNQSSPTITTTTTVATHTPGPNSSTFNVVSASGITVGRTLKVGTSPQYYTGVVTAVSGTTITMDLFNLTGEGGGIFAGVSQVASPAPVAGAVEAWADHDHGQYIDNHQHNDTHGHDPGTVDATVSGTTAPTTDVSNFGGPYFALPDHSHSMHIEVPNSTTQTSAVAGGTIASSPNTPETIALAFHKAVSGALQPSQVGTGLGGFVDGSICPPGWVEYTGARRRILKGAAAGTGEAVMVSAHSHSATFAQHTDSHNHGGSVSGGHTVYLDPGSGVISSTDPGAAVGPATWRDHQHDLALTGVSTVAAILSALTIASESKSGDYLLPPCYALRFCMKA